jgi:methylmalonyl-CoA mutase C-terminal domain/subunit
MTLIPKIVAELRSRGLDDVLVFAGGIIPPDDIETLRAEGVAAVFTPGSPLSAITEWLESALDSRERQPGQ